MPFRSSYAHSLTLEAPSKRCFFKVARTHYFWEPGIEPKMSQSGEPQNGFLPKWRYFFALLPKRRLKLKRDALTIKTKYNNILPEGKKCEVKLENAIFEYKKSRLVSEPWGTFPQRYNKSWLQHRYTQRQAVVNNKSKNTLTNLWFYGILSSRKSSPLAPSRVFTAACKVRRVEVFLKRTYVDIPLVLYLRHALRRFFFLYPTLYKTCK